MNSMMKTEVDQQRFEKDLRHKQMIKCKFVCEIFNPYHKKLLCQKSIKVLNSHYVQVDRKSGNERQVRYQDEVIFWCSLNLSAIVFHLGCGQEAIWAGVSLGSLASWGHGPKPVTTVMEGLVMLWVLDVFWTPSGLQPNSIKVSGHSQLPVKGLKARPKEKGVMLAFQDFKMKWRQNRFTWVTWVPI